MTRVRSKQLTTLFLISGIGIFVGYAVDGIASAPEAAPLPDEPSSAVELETPERLASTTTRAPSTEPCETLFGKPTEGSGLPDGATAPFCECGGISFSPPEYQESEIAELTRMRWLNPMPAPMSNPYENPEAYPERPDAVCGVVIDSADLEAYNLLTFDGEVEALEAGAHITHQGACGVCSSLENLAVYMASDDLTGPARQCAFRALTASQDASIECIQEIGFDYACARMWYYNARNTGRRCIGECAFSLNASYHNPDGTLNSCIQCDEDISGPIFRAVAGRTRRNSGLPSSLARPCDEVAQVVHDYR